jgi:hypothetical protein
MTLLEYLEAMTAKTKRSKYKNVRVVVNGVTFDSLAEAKRYSELKLLEKAGEIADLKRQERYNLWVNGHKVCAFVSDFSYVENSVPVVEDLKSQHTRSLPVFRLKAKLFKAIYGFDIRITGKGC